MRPALALLLLSAGCTAHELAAPAPRPEVQTSQTHREEDRKLDLLFVIDDSGSMEQEQDSLARAFPLFMRVLEEAGLPDLHLGIVSSDFGAGGIEQGGCHGRGDQGRFRVLPGCGLAAGGPGFLTVDPQGRQNFQGALTDVFACLASLGTRGCGYEHQLQSMRVALSPYNPELAAFLRPDARLAIVIISDEDDCSGEPTSQLYAASRPGEEPNLRCATAGHVCGGQEVPARAGFRAPLSSCRPFEHAGDDLSKRERLINVSEFVQFAKGLKPGRPDGVLVAGVIGWPSIPDVEYRTIQVSGDFGAPSVDLGPICRSSFGEAAPALRLKFFLDAFGGYGTLLSICDGDLQAAMEKIAQHFTRPYSCLPAVPIDADPTAPGIQPDCVVTERGATGGERPVLACAPGRPQPCWELVNDIACPGGVRVIVRRAGDAPGGTVERISCASEPGL